MLTHATFLTQQAKNMGRLAAAVAVVVAEVVAANGAVAVVVPAVRMWVTTRWASPPGPRSTNFTLDAQRRLSKRRFASWETPFKGLSKAFKGLQKAFQRPFQGLKKAF